MTNEHRQSLDKLGFQWDVPKGHISKEYLSWQDGFDELVEFKKKNGHCECFRSLVNKPAFSTPSSPAFRPGRVLLSNKNIKLAKWVKQQVCNFSKFVSFSSAMEDNSMWSLEVLWH
jgi:Helicase associated domain